MTKQEKAQRAITAAAALELNLVHFINSGGIGPGFVFDALQKFENAKAEYTGAGEGFQFTEHLRHQFITAGGAMRLDSRVQEVKEDPSKF